MFRISLLIIFVFLLCRAIIWLVQKHHDARGSGREFNRLVSEGILDESVYEGAVWREVERFGRRRMRAKLAKAQRRIIRDTKTFLRNEYLEAHPPSIYQYIIIFLIASVLGLVLETVYTFVMFGVVESRVGLVWGPFSPLYGCGAVLLTVCLWQVRDRPWWQIFLLSALLGGALEQTTGWGMERFANAESWTYLGLPDHITQWVAWRFLAMWGAHRAHLVQGHHARAHLPHRPAHHDPADGRGGRADRLHDARHRDDGGVLLARGPAASGRAAEQSLRGVRRHALR